MSTELDPRVDERAALLLRDLVSDRARVLCVQRTGWGKSAVYFLATALLREQRAGPALIVSPLLALMRNQIAAAERLGIRAHTINSTNREAWDEVRALLEADAVDLLLISPERLDNPQFRTQMLPLFAERVGLLVIDEAHCISDWGHDFRPDYRRLEEMIERLTGRGIAAEAYSGEIDSDRRIDVEERLLNNDLKAVVATSALGMGYDKPDLGFVVHYQAPGSVISYYQQVGRAGRAVDRAEVVLLRGAEDRRIQDFFIQQAFPPRELVDRVLARLGNGGGAGREPRAQG